MAEVIAAWPVLSDAAWALVLMLVRGAAGPLMR
jgi:hypothetical protein